VTSFSAKRVRSDVPQLNRMVFDRPITYLDTASTSLQPNAVIDAMSRYYQLRHANVHRAVYQTASEATAAYEGSREAVARFINAPGGAGEIVFTKNATESFNVLAKSWGAKNLMPGDVVLISEMEHHANIVPWFQLREQTGIEVRFIPTTDDYRLDLSRLDELMRGVKLLSITGMSNVLGTINPVTELATVAHRHGALIALDGAEIKYSTVQNWYPGDEEGRGGIYNFVTKRGDCRGRGSKISWTQVETGSAITWKYPSCILRGDDSVGEFYSIAITNNFQQADTGTKMLHLGRNTRSRIISKGISAGHAQNTYRGLVNVHPHASGARNYTQCDSLLIGGKCGAHTVPYIESRNPSARIEHEATTSKIADDQLFYCTSRGLDPEEAVALIVNGFCKEVLQQLPMEFAVEAQKLVGISLEGSVG